MLSVQSQLNRQIDRKTWALESVRRHFQILIEGVVDYAIFALDKEGHVTSWNSTSQKITGYTKEEIVGKQIVIVANLAPRTMFGETSNASNRRDSFTDRTGSRRRAP